MDLGNYAAVGLVIGQFVTGSEFSEMALRLGISTTVVLYITAYLLSY